MCSFLFGKKCAVSAILSHGILSALYDLRSLCTARCSWKTENVTKRASCLLVLVAKSGITARSIEVVPLPSTRGKGYEE